MQEKQDFDRISHRYDAYIKTVLKNFRTDYIRKNRDRWENECFIEDLPFSRKESLMGRKGDSDGEAFLRVNDRNYTKERIEEAIRLLPRKCSVVITLHYYRDLSDSKIGKMLGLAQKGGNYRRNEALKLLREMLEEPDDEKEE